VLLVASPSLVVLIVVLGAYGIGVSMNWPTFRAIVVTLTGFIAAQTWVLFYFFYGLPLGTASGPEAIPDYFKILAFYVV
jgi:hypothetical protein